MRITTLCYIEKDDAYLMLYRNKKKNDVNKGKWIGVGGGTEEGESIEACLLREVYEETGLRLSDWKYRAEISFLAVGFEQEIMHLFTSDRFSGELSECTEGKLAWIKKSDVFDLPLWEGDRIFLKALMEDAPFFRMKLRYDNDTLTEATMNGIDLLTDKEKRL